ncbi:hypothetical protein F4803DRAFT_518165 [Xylaria telfairii]|nr:hypothetical protein F4803DRAFT_518165 [Xylaria telfairii]
MTVNTAAVGTVDSAIVGGPSSSGSLNPAGICSYITPELSRTIIDPDGDLILRVGETRCIYIPRSDARSNHGPDQNQEHEHELPVIYVVCSKTLSRASPVWKKLLCGGFAESKPPCASSASDWVVELPDDNPKAMATILNIIHIRFGSLPRTADLISIEDLYQLTILTDKYDLTAVLRPWAAIWIKSAEEKHGPWKQKNHSPVISLTKRLLWIAWEMGDAGLFQRTSEELALHCSVDANGDLQNNTGNDIVPLFRSTLEPPGHHDALKAMRLQSLERALAIYGDAITNLLKKKTDPGRVKVCTVHRSWGQRWTCEAGMLGTMISSLVESGWWPLPSAASLLTNVAKLLQSLESIDIKSPIPEHIYCVGVQERDKKISDCLTAPLAKASTLAEARMAKQAVKSGVRS